ncbi:MAG: alpha/beta hydrolase [Coriobacteriales bacterium]|jgi:pimeloyl-ACP methyl ester carboxylesterase|nr:alpha/beta hydrolase [Coriobacteriales bacterium]
MATVTHPSNSLSSFEQTVALKDGRLLGILQTGDTDGFPVFYFHGSGSSRLESLLWSDSALENGIKLISLDRPGIGLSDYQSGYKVLDWPDDIAEVAEQLSIEKFAVIGMSMGGAYAMACAYKIPHRLTSCGLVSTISPAYILIKAAPIFMRMMGWVAKNLTILYKAFLRLTVTDKLKTKTADEKYLLQYSSILCEADRLILSDNGKMQILLQAMSESYRQSALAGREAALTLTKPWGFDLKDIKTESIYLWHGGKDGIMTINPIKLLVHELPNCVSFIYPDEGHFSLAVNYSNEILSRLKSD